MLSAQNVAWKNDLIEFASFYKTDMPNFLAFQSELNLWEKYWSTYNRDIPDNLTATLKATPFTFENIHVCLRILATLPVTSCECEGSFSALRRLKDYKRSTMLSEAPKWYCTVAYT